MTSLTGNPIVKNDKLCIDCGACVSVCPADALTFNANHSVKHDEGVCLGSTCGLCVDACVKRALKPSP